jgi:hypothetical protein
MMFRVSPEIHRKLALAAELSGKSLNQWAEEVLGNVVGRILLLFLWKIPDLNIAIFQIALRG